MVDFGNLRQRRTSARPIDPLEIFLRLPKAPGIDDLWNSQAEALRTWFARRTDRDMVIKLNTGGGKTLVGLLIAQSIMNEHRGPVLYLSPNNLLVDQTIRMAKEYGIQAVRYIRGQDLDDRFLAGQSVMVANYAALFNGLSKFGVVGTQTDTVKLEGLILDDAHTAFADMRDVFTLSVKSNAMPELYSELTHMFRTEFGKLGRQGTFDDVVADREHTILEVPYWAWLLRADEVRERLSPLAQQHYPFSWPLLRDGFHFCHALISSEEFIITAMYPMVDMFPSLADCPRRIYMSATVADDSSIVRTFDASAESVMDPIYPTSLAGVGERMILAPDLMVLKKQDSEGLVEKLAGWVASRFGGVIILTPSRQAADRWADAATVAQGDEVAACVDELRQGADKGPFAFPSRYDGIDLPGDSCRLVVLDRLPRSTNSYDLYRAAVLEGSNVINATIAQRIEQGMGRGTRGAGDHCVVLLTGKDLIAWISRAANLRLLTPSTRAQLEMGIEVSKNVGSLKELAGTMEKCLGRAHDWTEYHAEALADAAVAAETDAESLQVARCERRFFRLLRDGYYESAITTVEKFIDNNQQMSPQIKGWLHQMAARAAFMWGDEQKADELQRQSYADNRSVLRPRIAPPYVHISNPSKQSESIVRYVMSFQPTRGAISDFDEIADWLTPGASSNQFEEAFRKLGEILGFRAQRPDNEFGKGPDVLWVPSEGKSWIIEIKSRKNAANPLTKEEHGQLLEAFEWFRQEYPGLDGQKIVVHPNALATDRISVADSLVLTLAELTILLTNIRQLLSDLCFTPGGEGVLLERCELRLEALDLTPAKLTQKFLKGFSGG